MTAVAVGFNTEEARMRTIVAQSLGSILLASVLFLAAATIAGAGERKLLAVGSNHVAIRGYDAVAYFTDGKAIKGSIEFEYVFDNARWQFSSAAHRDMFATDPDHYMPQYGGFCAGAMVFGDLWPADPEAWTIVDGKLYMVASKRLLSQWKANFEANIRQADAHWPGVQQREAAQQ
jgi:hypothetical protein